MNIERVTSGDIVECVRRDRRFHALVTGRDGSKLAFVPLTHNCSYYYATAREVVGHWAERRHAAGAPRTRTIRPGDLIAFGGVDQPTYASVLDRDGRILHVRELKVSSASPHALATTEVTAHFARRGRRRAAR